MFNGFLPPTSASSPPPNTTIFLLPSSETFLASHKTTSATPPPPNTSLTIAIAGNDIQPETFGLIAEHNVEVLTQREFASSLPPSRTLDHMLASVGGLDSAAWRQGERHTDIDAARISAEDNAAASREVPEALSTGGNATDQGEASTSTTSQQSTGTATDSMNSGHAGPSTAEVTPQTSPLAQASVSGQESSTSAPSSDQSITAAFQPFPPTAEQRDEVAISPTSATVTEPPVEGHPTQASQSSLTSNDTSTPLVWTETSTSLQPPLNASTSMAGSSSSQTMAGESSSRALQPLSPNTRNIVPQRRAYVEDDEEEDENERRTPKRQRGEDVDVDVGESSSGVNMLA